MEQNNACKQKIINKTPNNLALYFTWHYFLHSFSWSFVEWH